MEDLNGAIDNRAFVDYNRLIAFWRYCTYIMLARPKVDNVAFGWLYKWRIGEDMKRMFILAVYHHELLWLVDSYLQCITVDGKLVLFA